MSTTKRVGAVLALVVFLLVGALYVAQMSAAQAALEAPPPNPTAELAAMTPAERAFVHEAASVAPQLGDYPADTLRMGYRACQLGALPEHRIRDEIVKMSLAGSYDLTRTQATVFWYRVKASPICV